ncbi:MAG: hypothetical protein OEM82_03450 [Acidobacteriota bacterium]|nr:hypothetical protein [Acidobacteriota bacterium]MDH3528164.1 hypothetical protein [Acidobacteriota bacterium]
MKTKHIIFAVFLPTLRLLTKGLSTQFEQKAGLVVKGPPQPVGHIAIDAKILGISVNLGKNNGELNVDAAEIGNMHEEEKAIRRLVELMRRTL